MKKTFLPKIALVGFVFALMCILVPSNASAQASPDDLFEPPQGPFVSPAVALQILDEAMLDQRLEMQNASHTSPEYRQAELRYVYFEYIVKIMTLDNAQTSEDIGVAIANGLRIYFSDAYGDITKDEMDTNKNTIISLLKI